MSENPSKPTFRSFLDHMLIMPRLHKILLVGAMFLAGGGAFGQVMDYLRGNGSPPAQQQQDQATSTEAPANPSAVAPIPDKTTEPTLGQKLSPWATRVGVGFVIGFVVGWIFRAFLKLMSLLTMAGVAIIGGLSYFHIMNVDFSSVERKYESSIAWVVDQGERLTKSLLNHIPGSASGFTGVFFGFRRKFTYPS